MEKRSVSLEYRVAGRKLVGYAAVFDTAAKIGGFSETIKPGAFSRTLAATNADVLALVDHDPSRLLARRSSGTLRLFQDTKGLGFEMDLAKTQLASDILEHAERRDLGGMSFGFSVPAGGDAWPSANQRELRTVDLAEISVVQAWPAYSTTSVEARSARNVSTDDLRLFILGLC